MFWRKRKVIRRIHATFYISKESYFNEKEVILNQGWCKSWFDLKTISRKFGFLLIHQLWFAWKRGNVYQPKKSCEAHISKREFDKFSSWVQDSLKQFIGWVWGRQYSLCDEDDTYCKFKHVSKFGTLKYPGVIESIPPTTGGLWFSGQSPSKTSFNWLQELWRQFSGLLDGRQYAVWEAPGGVCSLKHRACPWT